jgi:hypothetical protein
MADDEIREGGPKKPKKKAPPPDDEDRPRKKRPPDDEEEEDDRPRKKRRPVDDEEEAPRKKKKARDDDEDEEQEGDLGASPLSAIIPVGGSVFGLMSLWLSVLGVVLTILAFAWFAPKDVIGCILPSVWPISLLSGGLAFLTHKHKASYGSIAGNIRALIGIVISLGVMAAHGLLIFMYATSR